MTTTSPNPSTPSVHIPGRRHGSSAPSYKPAPPLNSHRPGVRRIIGNTALYLVMGLGALLSLLPFAIALFVSFKPTDQLFTSPMWLPPTEPTLDNYAQLFESTPFFKYLTFTLAVTVVITLGQVIFTTLAAYAFARMKFWGRDIIFWAYLATLMVPNVVTLIPLFLIMKEFGLNGAFLGIVAPYIFGTPFGIFLARQFFLGIPSELEEAGRIDGASAWGILWRIILPISKPVIATLAIITAVQAWNNFLWPLIIAGSSDNRVVTVGIAALSSNSGAQYGLMMAAAVTALIPIVTLFVFFQRHIVSSIAITGLK
jgi:multiple sugar transport system permease protein